ncbi:MAG: DUF1566 domain-containing protein [Nanoarchaeota archaeon]
MKWSKLILIVIIFFGFNISVFAENKDISIFFANGMFNSMSDIIKSRLALKYKLKSHFSSEVDIKFFVAYNDSENLISQLKEVTRQKRLDTWAAFYKILAGIEVAPDWFQEAMNDLAASTNTANYVKDEDLQRHVQQYKDEIAEGRCVIVVSHSQGNFYANSAYEFMEGECFSIVAVATPASFVGGDGEYTTLTDDAIINAVRLVSPLTLVANVTNSDSENAHAFESYLNGNVSGPRIVEHVLDEIFVDNPPLIVTRKLPDTGQTSCYDGSGNIITCPFPNQPLAQDGSYAANPPSYTNNGDGTVTDNNTGLVWQQSDDNYSYAFLEAVNYCDNLTLAGYLDWRMPEVMELQYIVNSGTYYPAINSVFSGTDYGYYWTFTSYKYYSWLNWIVGFIRGFVYYDTSHLSHSYPVRCVRGAKASVVFSNNEEGIINDLSTGLSWQQGEGGAKTWESALLYCENFVLAGKSDWRLPNRIELATIVDYSRYNPSINTFYFSNAISSNYWSSTTCIDYSNKAWRSNFYYGHITYGDKNNLHDVRCVRGGNN